MEIMHFGAVNLNDLAAVIAGIVGVIVVLLARRGKLPKWLARTLGQIGLERIEEAIAYANKWKQMDDLERSGAARAYLQRIVLRELGIYLPDSVANLLVEYVYGLIRRQHRTPDARSEPAKEYQIEPDKL